MKYHLDGKRFRSVMTTSSGQVDEHTVFQYHQDGARVWAEYSGGAIVRGHLVAIQSPDGTLDMRYHHINTNNIIMIGKCHSVPSLTVDNKIMLREEWEWIGGACSKGQSVILEI